MATILDVELRNFDAHIALNAQRFQRIDELFTKTSDQIDHIESEIKLIRKDLDSSQRAMVVATISVIGALVSAIATVVVAVVITG